MCIQLEKPIVMVIDDDKSLQKILGVVLTKFGFEIEAIQSGEQALQLLKSKHVDIVVCDVCLPGICGEQLIRNIRALQPDTQIIIISGYSYDQSEITIDNSLYRAWLQKPFSFHSLIFEIKSAWGSRSKPRKKKVASTPEILVPTKSSPSQKALIT